MSLATLKTKIEKLIEKARKTDEFENLIDDSGVLDSTDGTATEKVEQLIEKAEVEKHIYNASLLKENCQNEFRYWTGKKIPKTNFIKSSYFNYFVADSSVETIDYYLDWQKGIDLNYAFQNTPNLKTMVGVYTANAITVASMFNNSGIVSIQEPFDFSKIANKNNTTAFTTANSLVDVCFVEESIKFSIRFGSGKLSANSIQSIIDGLAYVETLTKITLHSSVATKILNDENLSAKLADKNWYVG